MVMYICDHKKLKRTRMSYIGLHPTTCIDSLVVILTYANTTYYLYRARKHSNCGELGKLITSFLILCNQNMVFHM